MRTTLTCDGCDREVAEPAARWCGHCGHPLTVPARRPAAAQGGPVAPVPLEGGDAPAPTEAERAPISGRSRAVGAAVVVLVLGGLLAIQASRQVPAEPHGYTDRGVPARTGVASVEPVGELGEIAWRTSLELPPFTPATATVHASRDLVYVLDPAGRQGVTAHDAASGEVRWSRPDLPLSDDEPVIAGDVLVVGSPDGGRVALGPDGTVQWELTEGLVSPVAAGGGIADIRPGAVVVLREAATGGERWSVDIAAALDASAQYVLPGGPDDLVVVLATRPRGLALGSNPELETGHLVGIEARTGEIRWELDLPPGLAWFQQPIAIDERVAVAANVSIVAFWDLASGRLLAEHPRPLAFRPLSVAAADGAAVLLDPLGTVTAIDVDGTTRWSVDTTLPATVDVRDGSVLVSTSRRITVHDVLSGRATGGLPVDAASRRGPPGPDGSGFVLRRDGRLVGYDPTGGSRFEHHTLVPPAPAPAVADGVIYAATGAGVSVLSAEDGGSLWEYRSSDPASIAGELYTPVVHGDVVIVSPSRSQPPEVGGVFALQRDTGILAWQRLTDRPSPRGPLTFDRDLAVLPVGDELHGHAPDGGRRALAAVAYGRRGPIAASAGLLVAATPPGEHGSDGGPTVVAIRRADRSRVWEEPAASCSAPSIADELVVVGTARGLRTFDLITGAPRWSTELTEGPVCGDLVLGGGRVVGVSGGMTLVAAELTDGDIAWSRGLSAAVAAPPSLVGSELLVPLVDGTLVAVDITDGRERWSLAVGGVPASSPVVADGRVVLLLRDGRLVALEPA